MKDFLTTCGLTVLAIPALVSMSATALFGQETKRADVSEVSKKFPTAVEWRFDEAQPEWKSALPLPASRKTVEVERAADALRVTLPEGSRISESLLSGGIYVDLPDWRREEWGDLIVRVRTTGSINNMWIGLNPRDDGIPAGSTQATFRAIGGFTPVVRDGLIHTYRIRLIWGTERTGSWRRVGLQFQAPKPGSIDILSVRIEPAKAQITETIIEPPQLKSDFALLRLALEEAHPALYRFTTKRAMDAEFARAEARLTRAMTILQFHNVLAPVLAAKKITGGINRYQGDEISALINSSKLFPLALAFQSRRAFVVLNRGRDERVRPGMEVLAINGQPLPETLRRILPNLVQDGDIRTRQMYELGSSDFVRPWLPGGSALFGEAYRLYIGDPSRFSTTLRDPQTGRTVDVDLAGVTNAEVAGNVEQNPVNRDVLAGIRTLRALNPRQSIRYLDGEDTAVLVPIFGGDFPDFIKKAFAELKNNGAKNLIVDMRGNTGGSDTYPPLLFSYLTSKEFLHMEQVRLKTYQPSFMKYTNQDIDPATDGYFGPSFGFWKPDPNGGWLMTEKYPIIGVQKPSENHFDGPVYVLIDGGTISAGSEFSATADFYKRATFIGEETGGAAEGDTGGLDIGPTLPASHLHINIPTEAFFSVVDKRNRRRGIRPTHAVTQTIDDLANGRDTVLEFTRELIRSRKRH